MGFRCGRVRRRGRRSLPEAGCLARSTPARCRGCRCEKRGAGRTREHRSGVRTDRRAERDPA
ncbi:MAG: hypothetical protein DMG55_03845 [Acidobacteria bacterium]|nr:MAG: hypothetical protein DMG55_03845 [Acidobacteriota bacterium]